MIYADGARRDEDRTLAVRVRRRHDGMPSNDAVNLDGSPAESPCAVSEER